MNPVELFNPSGKPAQVWYCGKCRCVSASLHMAEQCCDPKCDKCGKPVPQGHCRCTACWNESQDKAEKARFEKAKHLKPEEYTGWIYSDGLGWSEGYFECIDDLIDYCKEEDADIPEYVWATNEVHFAQASIDDLLSNIHDRAYEDFETESLHGLPELKKAIETFNEANKYVVSYEVDYSRAIMIAKEIDGTGGEQ